MIYTHSASGSNEFSNRFHGVRNQKFAILSYGETAQDTFASFEYSGVRNQCFAIADKEGYCSYGSLFVARGVRDVARNVMVARGCENGYTSPGYTHNDAGASGVRNP